MAMNWFEGGRRIVSLIGVLIVIGAVTYLFAGRGDDRIILESSSPGERLHWTLKECDYPDLEKEWDETTEFNSGDPRGVVACFRAKPNGRIEYAYGREIEVPTPVRPGEKPLPPAKVRRVFEANSFSDEVERYALARMNAFAFTAQEAESVAAGQWKIGVARFCERAIDALPWIAGLITGLWIIAAGIGWLIRGFAGIPNGRDFKVDDLNNAARSNRASLEWLATAVGGWCLLSGVAWIVLKVMTPATTAVGRIVWMVLHVAGTLLLMGGGFTIFLVGAFGLRALTFRLLKREEPNWEADDKSIWAFGIANGILLALISWPLNTYTLVGTWVDGLDHWSRANGFADGGTVGLFILCLLWPFAPLYALSRAKAYAGHEGDTKC